MDKEKGQGMKSRTRLIPVQQDAKCPANGYLSP